NSDTHLPARVGQKTNASQLDLFLQTPLIQDIPFYSVEPFNCRLYGGSSFFFDFPRPVKRLHCNAADFMHQLADLGLQAPPAFLNAIENIVLYARAVHFQKMLQEFPSIVGDEFASTYK